LATDETLICATCRHSLPVDPVGSWARAGFDHASHIHCGWSKLGKAQVIRKASACTWNPVRWEEKDAAATAPA
jgi:hypothetical protein